MPVLADIGTKVGGEIKNLGIRMSAAETAIVNLGGQTPPPTGNFTIEPVTWTNLTEINLSGEKLSNISFDPPPLGLGVDVEVIVQWINGGKTASVGQIYTIDLVQSTGGMRLTGNGQSLFASAAQLTTNVVALHPWESNSSYSLPTGTNGTNAPPNGWSWEEFVIDLRVKWVGSSTNNHTEGNVYQANAYRPAWTNYSGNIRIKNDSDNYGWVGNNRGTDWEVVERAPYQWATSSSIRVDQSKLAQGIIKGDGGAVSIQQIFSNPIASGTKLVAKVTRADTNENGTVHVSTLRANGTPYGSNRNVPFADGYVEFETTETTYGLRLSTAHGNREVSSVSLFQGEVSGGSVQTFTGGSIEKISGAGSYNAGASSVQKIDGQKDGYVQFQIGHATNSLKIGLVNQDHDFEVDAPWKMNFGGGHVDMAAPFIADHTSYESGDWFRIRHYSQSNEVEFQKRQIVYGHDTSFVFATASGSNYAYPSDQRPLVIALLTQSGLTIGQYYRVHAVRASDQALHLKDLDGNSVGWHKGVRGSRFEVVEELGEDYVTFYTHPVLSNGGDLYVDTVFHAVGARLNDVQIAYK